MNPSLILLVALFGAAAARDQAVGARGQLMCGNQPLANAEVKLWELDTWPDPDDLLSTVYTDSQGRFTIQGTENELTTISPVVKFYHTCNNRGLFNLPALCKRKVTYAIPSSYIVNGRSTNRFYDFGTLNMEAKQPNEDTECF